MTSGHAGNCRFVQDVARRGACHMALDEVLARRASATGLRTLRVYSFEPACVTLGRSQEIGLVVDAASCELAGIDVVRRPTGGGAILHSGDITYCYTSPLDAFYGNVRDECFSFVAEGVIEALRLLGIDACTSRHRGSRSPDGWCFDREFGVDIEWQGRKICGSAQRVTGRAVLQHGTVFLERHAAIVVPYATGGVAPLADPPVNLEEVVGRPVDFSRAAEAFKRGFAAAHGLVLEEGSLDSGECREAGLLCAARHGAPCAGRGNNEGHVCDIIGQRNSAGDDDERQRR